MALRDIYLRLSLEHDFVPVEHVILSAGASLAYFWYPSSEYWNSPAVGGYGDDHRGLSDVVGSIGFTTDVWPAFTPTLALNVVYVPDQDFDRVWGRDQNVHVCVTAGVSYAWSWGERSPGGGAGLPGSPPGAM